MLFFSQKDLIAMLISQTNVRQSDLSSSVLKALNGNEEQFKAVVE